MQPPLVLVEGTWGGDDWAGPAAPFRAFLHSEGFTVYPRTDFFDEEVGGVPLIRRDNKSGWRIGGEFLADTILRLGCCDVLAHSYGGVCAIFAATSETLAARPYAIRRLITVATPERHDMDVLAQAAAKRIGYWMNVGDTKGDRMQRWAQLFDAQLFGWSWRQRRAHLNVLIPGVGHSGLLKDTRLFPLWKTQHLLDILTLSDEALGVPSARF